MALTRAINGRYNYRQRVERGCDFVGHRVTHGCQGKATLPTKLSVIFISHITAPGNHRITARVSWSLTSLFSTNMAISETNYCKKYMYKLNANYTAVTNTWSTQRGFALVSCTVLRGPQLVGSSNMCYDLLNL